MTYEPPATATDPLGALPWPLATERLSLRRVTPPDAEAMWSYRRLPEVTHWLTFLPRDLDDWRELLAAPQRLATTLVAEHDGRIVGDFYLRVEDSWAQREVTDQARGVQAELGWVLDPAFGGRGYATEGCRALLRVCFEELKLRRVCANAFAGNEASWRLMERLGMRREQYTVRESLHRELGWVDGVGYALLADEWARGTDPA
ncbi:GNAT family N-acetyltransferase [Streptomyces abyssomicinicus]|uniref:GNAT family N-acetyltransferase n=1 Tax=Streptomyces abyssomicinicus TaxID=574929 RepID=UPI001C3FC1AB|nr:GNAT family protein [Streptomyces abyssomicinicus]